MQPTEITNEILHPIQTKDRERFYNRSLTELRENEMNIKQYWSKLVLVTIPNLTTHSSQEGEVRFRGEFSYCDDAGWVGFNEVIYEKHPEAQFLEGIHSPAYHSPIIDDIILIEEEDIYDEKDQEIKANDANTENNTPYRLGKSIKNIILDVIRLKLVRKALMKLPASYPALAPLNMYNRKIYFRKLISEVSKRCIGDGILNMKKIPEDLYSDLLFASSFQDAIFEDENIKTNHCNYNLDDALSLLNDYYDLWVQHIQKHNAEMDDRDEQKEEKKNIISYKNYMQWDDFELVKNPPITSYIPPEYNSELQTETAYRKPVKSMFITSAVIGRKVENIYVGTIWPYYFVGPFTKLKKNNPDWLCMNIYCHKQYTTPFTYIIDDVTENIYFYKANRTDMTMEVCHTCIDVYLFAEKSKKTAQKRLKASKRSYKRLKKKLAEYAEKEIPWTPPPILNGMPYYGIPVPGMPINGPIYSLPYPQLPYYMPGMNPPLSTIPPRPIMNYIPPMIQPGTLGPKYPYAMSPPKPGSKYPYSIPPKPRSKYSMPYSMPRPKPGPLPTLPVSSYYYGVPNFQVIGTTYSLPYPMLPSYNPGMNPPLQPMQSNAFIKK